MHTTNKEQQQALLERIQFFEARKRMKKETIRAQYIHPHEITG